MDIDDMVGQMTDEEALLAVLQHMTNMRNIVATLLLHLRRQGIKSPFVRCDDLFTRGGAALGRKHACRVPGNKRKARNAGILDSATGRCLRGRALWERDYRGTSWFKDYLTLHPASYYDDPRRRDERAVHRREFEAKIRMPLHLFQSLLAKMEADPAMRADIRKAVPLNVQLAASLRFLAIGCWDAMDDIFKVSKRTLRHWFHD